MKHSFSRRSIQLPCYTNMKPLEDAPLARYRCGRSFLINLGARACSSWGQAEEEEEEEKEEEEEEDCIQS